MTYFFDVLWVFIKLKLAETWPVFVILVVITVFAFIIRYFMFQWRTQASLIDNDPYYFQILIAFLMSGTIGLMIALLYVSIFNLALWLISNWHQAQEIVGGR